MFRNIEFQEIVYTIKERWQFGKTRQKRCLLKGVTGFFPQGQLTGIMGPSGAGKSSLLNAISGFRTDGVKGAIKINRKESCYITQDDLHQPLLTVEEIMSVACELKMKNPVNKSVLIDDILRSLNLTARRGNTAKQLSGGEKRRLSIALELVANPSVLFLDEPTSGLDEVTAAQCVRLLREITKQGKTIVCTIHQPSGAILRLFDHMYVLAKGECVYQGPPLSIVPFMASRGYECPKHYNPSDFIIELCDADNDVIASLSEAIGNGKSLVTPEADKEGNAVGFTLKNAVTSMVLDTTSPPRSSILEKMKALKRFVKSDYAHSSFRQFLVLTRMMHTKIYRNRIALGIQLFHHLICGSMLGLIFFNSANDGERMFDHLKFSIAIVFFLSYTQIIVPVLSYPLEVKLVKKECFNRWYGLTPYYLALTLSRIPLQVFFNILFLSLVYWLPGLPMQLWRFGLFSFVGVIISLVAEGLGLTIGSTFSITNGCATGPMILAPMLGLAIYGFDFAAEIPLQMYALMKLSFLRIGVVSIVLITFGYNREQLDCNYIYCHFDDPKVLLRYLRIEEVSLWHELIFLFGLMIVFRVLLYFSLRKRLK
ncbi:ATP-binding cassette subfamily G member 4 [Phlebotomus argentipes]|uniref:ATP-binding cassette subfamily G member 4 n=1 Tax=Phlebotomus argentipes TaxID=94469 RepID=UPI0028932EFC|nr:ATP-binding cassette subfamily G member 4 [Phlebotomus argentipes]XP_059622464.1 ATP-binding cassette subfamily G member 4 [Phlebotomus argentipes]XP_059622466.1 ATP-binding cassette subfamily G member 4 [Phlebotomus argentipes]